MKATGKALIVAGSLLILGIIFIAGGGLIINNKYEKAKAEMPELKEFVYEAKTEDIKDLETKLESEDVEIITTDSEKIRITYYDIEEESTYKFTEANKKLVMEKQEKLKLSISGSGLSITNFDELFARNVNIEASVPKFKIEIPETYEGSAKFKGTSGNYEISDIDFENTLRIELSSGDIYVQNTTSKNDIDISCTSGTIQLSNIIAGGDLNIDSSSGDITIKDITAENSLNCATTSGNFEGVNIVTAIFNKASTSGDTAIAGLSGATAINCVSTSGDFNVTLSGELEDYSISCQTTSGTSNLPSSYVSEKNNKISVSVTSGDVNFIFE